MFRYRKATKKYKKHRDAVCPFCHPPKENILAETAHARVVKNLFPYDLWEFRNVTEHYMVVPKRHVKSLIDLSIEEQQEIMRIIAEFEGNNFNIYARASDSIQRTVPMHQHTHLIKTTNHRQARAGIYLKKPYFLAKI